MSLVSCICTTIPSRFPHLQRAILNYCEQTYAAKELIIVTSDPKHAVQIQSFLINNTSRCGGHKIKVISRPYVRQVLDGLVQALTVARGDYIAIWDDDNLSDPRRLAAQMDRQILVGQTGVTVLANAMYHYRDTNELFVVDFSDNAASLPVSHRCCTPTAIYPRDLLPPLDASTRNYPSADMLNYCANNFNHIKVNILRSRENLFLAGIHFVGHIKPFEYYRTLASNALGTKTATWLKLNQEEIVKALIQFKWDHPEIDVEGVDGSGFKFSVPDSNQWINHVVTPMPKLEMPDVVRESVNDA